MKITQEQLIDRALNFVYHNVTKEVTKKLLFDEMDSQSLCDSCQYLLDKAATGKEGYFTFKAATKYPIVAIGGPVALLMPPVCERLNTKLVLPPHYEVGNAVGAISGVVMETVIVQIVPKEEGIAAIFGLEEPIYIAGDRALYIAKTEAEKLALERAAKAGIQDPKIKTVIRPLGEKAMVLFYELGKGISADMMGDTRQTTVSSGTEVVVTAIGKPIMAK